MTCVILNITGYFKQYLNVCEICLEKSPILKQKN